MITTTRDKKSGGKNITMSKNTIQREQGIQMRNNYVCFASG